MNNKGFSLIELLVSFVILGLIITLAITSYTKISKGVKVKQKNNLISKIEIAASNYAYETNKTMIFVDELVLNGYLEEENDNGDIIDPTTGNRLNCYVVEMEKVGDYYNAKFIKNKNYDNKGVCDQTKLSDYSGYIEVKMNGTSVSDTSKWLRGEIELNAYDYTYGYNFDCINNSCVWTSNSGLKTNDVSHIIINNTNTILKTKYTFQYSEYTKNSVNRHTSSIDIKIDNEMPIIYEPTIYDKSIVTSSKKVIINASDGNGSGISGYYMAISYGQDCNDVTFTNDKEININANGEYIICVKDNVGNVNSKLVTMNNIG